VNVLMALLWENHEHHQVARAWLRGVSDFATCPVSQLGFSRVSSHPALGYSMSPDQAFSVLRTFLANPRHHFVPDDLSCEDRVLRTDLMGRREPSHGPLSRRTGAAAWFCFGHVRRTVSKQLCSGKRSHSIGPIESSDVVIVNATVQCRVTLNEKA
jgi:hypothetical protein